jgi:N6-L-threonylcarbamoyladenine synthase
MNIISIETSCDDTGVAVISLGDSGTVHVLSNQLSTQTQHAAYGGVFPTVAKREHARMLVPLLTRALAESFPTDQTSVTRSDLCMSEEQKEYLSALLAREPELLAQIIPFFESHARPDIDAIAVTVGPGLEPCLWVGICAAKALAYAWSVPVVGVNHMEGHVYAALVKFTDDGLQMTGTDRGSEVVTPTVNCKLSTVNYPLLSLLISGGHTELVLSAEEGAYTILGQTRDDAVGECFDKCARMLGLEYPGGPKIGKLAAEARAENIPRLFTLPRPMLHSNDLDFSFSGLKTAVLKVLKEHRSSTSMEITESEKKALAREIEEAITDVLVAKTRRALEESAARTLVMSGGVSASTYIREKIGELIMSEYPAVTLLFSPRELATDNALMIALASIAKVEGKEFTEIDKLVANGNMRLGAVYS